MQLTYVMLTKSVLSGTQKNSPVTLSNVAPGGRSVSSQRVVTSPSASVTVMICVLFCCAVTLKVGEVELKVGLRLAEN